MEFLQTLFEKRINFWRITFIKAIFETQIFDFIAGDEMVLEREPLERVATLGELNAYKHRGLVMYGYCQG